MPVVLTLGTKYVIADNPQWWRDFLKENVTILAMNEDEALELTGLSDPLTASDMALEWVDLVLCTAGPNGLYGGLHRRGQQAADPAPAVAGAYRRVQPLRIQPRHAREHCENPLRVYSHIAPYMGGPERIMNTNGAGDGALSALLHDIAANGYHRHNVPNSSKHVRSYLTYSSLAQVQIRQPRQLPVLNQHSPRLTRGLPERKTAGRILLGALTR